MRKVIAAAFAAFVISALITLRVIKKKEENKKKFNSIFRMGFECGEDYGRRAEHVKPKYGNLD